MSTVERKAREKERRHADIIHAAERLFHAKGYANVTMDDIAKEAELAKGTLYLYFDNKESLYTTLLLRGITVFKNLIVEAMAGKKTGLLKTQAIGTALYGLSEQYPQYFDMIAAWYTLPYPDLVDTINKALADRTLGVFELCVSTIQSGIDDGSIRPGLDPGLTCLFLFESTVAMIRIARANPGEPLPGLSKAEIIRFTFDRLAQSIENRP